MIILGIGLMPVSCQVHKPIEGLCYTDKQGTYLCDESEKIKKELEEEGIDLLSIPWVSKDN